MQSGVRLISAHESVPQHDVLSVVDSWNHLPSPPKKVGESHDYVYNIIQNAFDNNRLT